MMTDLTSAPALAPEPSRLRAMRSVLLGRPGSIFGCAIIVIFVLVAVLAPLLAPYDPITQSMARIN